MPRRTKTLPTYRLHRSTSRAMVTIDGRDIYLGRNGTKASLIEYDRIWKMSDSNP